MKPIDSMNPQFPSLILLLFLAMTTSVNGRLTRVKRDRWRMWEGVEVECESRQTDDPCVTCSCTKLGIVVEGYDYNKCEETVTECHARVPCADSVIKPGDCCPTCPNGPNCRIYGQLVNPSGDKIRKEGSTDEEYAICESSGKVKICTVTTYKLGSSEFWRTDCAYSLTDFAELEPEGPL